MKWLLIALWLGILTACLALWEKRSKRKIRAKVAAQRTGLNLTAYVKEMGSCGVDAKVSTLLYDELSTYCAEGIRPNPNDGLFGFYFFDGDDLEDFLPTVFNGLGLTLPASRDQEIAPHLKSARHLAIFLQSKLVAQNPS